MVSKAEFSRMAKVTGAAITLAISRGRIHAERDGSINPSRRENAEYLTTSKRQRRQGKRQPGGKPAAKTQQRQARSAGSRKPRGKRVAEKPEGGGPLTLDGETYGMAELRKMVAQADKEEQNNAIRRGELVERTDVHRIFARMYQVHTSQLKTLADKLGPDIAATFKLADADTPKVQELVGLEVRRSLAQIKKEMNEYLDAIGDGEVSE